MTHEVLPKKIDHDTARILLAALERVTPPERELLVARLLAAHRLRAREKLLKPFRRFADTARYVAKDAAVGHERRAWHETLWRQLEDVITKATADRDESL